MRKSLKTKAEEEEKVKHVESDNDSGSEDANPLTKKRKSRGKLGGPRSKRREGDSDESEKESIEEELASPKKNKRLSKGRSSTANNNGVESEKESVDEEEPASSKRSKRVSKGKRSAANDSDMEENVESGSDGEQVLLSKKMKAVKKSPAKNGLSKGRKRAAELEEKVEYEVESVVGFRVQRGKRQFRIHWKGFKDEDDTWENEDGLDCKEAIEEYLNANPDSDEQTDKKPLKSTKKDDKTKAKKKEKNSQDEDDSDGNVSQEEYEVERILDVFIKKNGKREFLIRWKGYGNHDDTWEPEEHLNCADLIKKYEEKIDKAKSVEAKELRVSRKPTERFTLNMESQGRRLSRRGVGKQRKRYDDAE